MENPQIFISYSHRDQEIVDRLMVFLKPLERLGSVQLWDDRRISAGESWKAEIDSALHRAAVAILVVSPDYLASDFVNDIEVPTLLERRASGDLFVIPLIVSPSLWSEVPWLRKLQSWPKSGKPLLTLEVYERDKELVALTREIGTILELFGERTTLGLSAERTLVHQGRNSSTV